MSGVRRVVAVAFVVLLVTATFSTPVGASLTVASSAAGNTSIDDSLTPREKKTTALETLSEVPAHTGQQDAALERSRRTLYNGTVGVYRSPIRLNSSAPFRKDAQGVRALASFGGSDEEAAVLRVSKLVVVADNESAAQEIADAKRALDVSRSSLTTGQRRGAEAHIRNAERAFERAQRVRDRAEKAKRPKRAIRTRARSLVALKTAWRQARQALLRMDRGRTPRISVESTVDPVWQDGQPDRYYLTGNYSDVVLSDPGPVRITVGNRTVTTDAVSASGSPVANRTFRVELDRNDRIANVTVRVADRETGSNATATLPLDGDGLPGSFEHRVGSDPLDPDGDVAELDGDQAGDGVHDGAAVARSDRFGSVDVNATVQRPTPVVVGNDTDGDAIPDGRERQLGTNVTRNDTDRDGVTDRFETNGGARVDTDGDGALDALDRDADGDGTTDASERRTDADADLLENYRDHDDDGDGIRTAVEVEDGKPTLLDADFDRTANWLDVDADGDGSSDAAEGTADADGDDVPAYLDNDGDNDGLPGSYEANVTGTNATDADSDFPGTDAVEADDGTPDGVEDPDDDALDTHGESVLGTDPFAADSDDDGLSDYFEARHDPAVAPRDRFDPLTADTNGDGVPDGEQDHDGDGLATTRERDLGTTFDRNDTDDDDVDDARELDIDTDPLANDTDDDALPDGEELTLPTEPTDPDTDDDGVLDGDETFETVARNASTGVHVSVRGTGNVAKSVSITPRPTYFDGTNASAGPTVRLTNRSAFRSATVEIPVAESIPESEYEDLAIYTWNGSASDAWSPLETTIENGTATAETDHFSFFTVLDSDEWVSATTAAPGGGGTSGEPIAFEAQRNFTCGGACTVENESTLLVGGEPNARTITVEQGNESFEVVPLSNGQSIEEFYNYGDAEINSPLPIAKSDASRLFFWSGPKGISLVALHDKPRDGSGAAVDLGFDGLPLNSGRWVVEDDGGDFNQGSATRPHWTWTADNTDGGVFRGGLTNQAITVTPHFNEEASQDPLTPGRLTSWEVLTGQATAPEHHSLSMDEPVTIHVPDAPAENESATTAGDSGSASFEYDLAGGMEELAVRYQTQQTNVDPNATVTLEGANGTAVTESLNVGTVGTVEEVLNVSSLGAGPVNVSVAADGLDARVQLIPRTTEIDGDGDGIADRLEDRNWTARNGPAQSFRTSSDDADTDGDGILDGEEAHFATETVDGERRVTSTLSSNPSLADTDEDGLDDAEEGQLRTNPLLIDTEGDGLKDAEDPRPTVPNDLTEDAEQSFHLSNGRPTSEFLDGMVYGDWGYVHERTGSRTAAYLFGWIFPFLATAAGTLGPLEDPVEAALEVRDCLAINDALWENALDCGFAAWELASSGAKIVGAATSITGFGAVLAGGAIAADEVQDVGRAVTVTVDAVKKAPASKVEPVGRLIGTQFGGIGTELVRRAADKLPGSKADDLVTGLRRAELEQAGLSGEVAEQVAKNVDDVGSAKQVVKRLDSFDEVPVAMRSDLVTKLAKQDNADELTKASTLRSCGRS